jgi:hypothetical protein
VDPDSGAIGATDEVPLPTEVHNPQIAVWSRDGREIAIEDASAPTERTLWIAPAVGRSASRVVKYSCTTYCGVDWLPDGSGLVIAALEGGRMNILSVARTGGTPRLLSKGEGNLYYPRVSPTGRWIAATRLETSQTLVSIPMNAAGTIDSLNPERCVIPAVSARKEGIQLLHAGESRSHVRHRTCLDGSPIRCDCPGQRDQ